MKYRIHPNDIAHFARKKMVNFKTLFPEFAGYRQHFGMATFAVDDDVKRQVLAEGLTLLQRRGKVIETLM